MKTVIEKLYVLIEICYSGIKIKNPGICIPGFFKEIKIQSLPDFRRRNDTR